MDSNKMLLTEIQYFPLVNWFKYSFQNKHIKILSCERYRKMSFRNRTPICGSNGLINLSVPLQKGRNQKFIFRDVRIAYTDKWQLNHWRGILSCYSKSPFFEFYQDDLEKIFQRQDIFLFDLNIEILVWLKKVLKFPGEIEVINEEDFKIDPEYDCRDKWLPRNFQEDTHVIKYPQVFEDRIGFQKNVSILDLLFNVGPAAKDLLT